MSDPALNENPFGDPAELASRAFPDAMDGTSAPPELQAVDPTKQVLTPVLDLSAEMLEHYKQIRDVDERVQTAMHQLKLAQGEVKDELKAGVELGIPKWIFKLGMKVRDMDEAQRAEFFAALDSITNGLGVKNTQTNLF